VVGLAFGVREINHHVRLGHNVVRTPARWRHVRDELFTHQFHLRIVHTHVPVDKFLDARSNQNLRFPN